MCVRAKTEVTGGERLNAGLQRGVNWGLPQAGSWMFLHEEVHVQVLSLAIGPEGNKCEGGEL